MVCASVDETLRAFSGSLITFKRCTNASRDQFPIPVTLSGVILADRTVLLPIRKSRPPPNSIPATALPFKFRVWQSMQAAAVTRYAPYFKVSAGLGIVPKLAF